MAYLPMAVYGLEVPPGDMAISARPDIPAAFRITMAAIDPTAEAEDGSTGPHRATLKIIRLPITSDDYDIDSDEDSEEDDFDPEEMEAMLAEDGEDSEDDDDDEDEDVNGGPSDPAKSKKARKAAAVAQIKSLLAEEGMDLDEDGVVNGLNGVVKSAKAKGKQPITDLDEDDDDEEDEDDDEDEDDFSDGEDGAEIEEYVICTLDTEKQYQQTLDIAIGEDERVWFKVSGSHAVYLTGNYIEPVDASYDDDSDEDSELDYDLEPDEDEIDELDELDDLSSRVVEVDDEDIPTLVKSKKGNKRAVEDVDVSEDLDDMIAKEEKLSKKQAKKLKKNDGTAAEVNGSTGKKVAFAKEIEQGPTPSKNAPGQASNKSVSIKTVNGVTLDDRKIGTGPVAKKGDRVGLRYIGKLQGGKVFDANKKGKPFTFKLGSGEVIKGWDIGVAGMSVGGERRIIIPPHLAYGSKSIPDIPGNSTLTFDVKVIEINKGK